MTSFTYLSILAIGTLLLFPSCKGKQGASSASASSTVGEKEVLDYSVVGNVPESRKALIEAARWQIGKTVSYNPAYERLSYPMGDIPLERGVCTDVVIRAFRRGLDLDLQQLVHEDMRSNFSVYPKNWGLRKPDKNIDHRRVPNLEKYFSRQGWSKLVSDDAEDYLPGDIVVCYVDNKRPHIMIISDRVNKEGIPLTIHNRGGGTRENNYLFGSPLKGHYRLPVEE